MKEIDAIIIGKNYSTSLGIIKALGEVGYSCAVIKLANRRPKIETPEVKSKYVHSYAYASNLDDQAVLEAINRYCGSTKRVLIPSDDYSASLLDRFYHTLSENFYIPNMGEEAGCLSLFMDKGTQKKLACKMGVCAAKCWSIEVTDKNYKLPLDISYPCFSKPQMSIGAPKTFIKKCNNEKELIEQLDYILSVYPCNVLIEEAIEVENEYTVPGISLGGNVVIPAFLRKIKIGSGKHKGVTAIGVIESSDKYSDLTLCLKKYIASTKMTGIFDIELLENNGNFYLNEVNLRYGAAGYAVTAAGINLPGTYVDYLYGKNILCEDKLQSGKIFVNEKAELDDYEAGFCTWDDYQSEINQADICFMRGAGDPPSRRAFKFLEIKTRVKKIIKKR